MRLTSKHTFVLLPTIAAVSGSCVIDVTFTPAAAGVLTAAVSKANNAIGSPHTVAITGTRR